LYRSIFLVAFIADLLLEKTNLARNEVPTRTNRTKLVQTLEGTSTVH